jgi:hypothetical protein
MFCEFCYSPTDAGPNISFATMSGAHSSAPQFRIRGSSAGVKLEERRANHSSPSTAEV